MPSKKNRRNPRPNAKPIVLCALLILFPIAGRTQDSTCRSEVCKLVAEVIDQTVNDTLEPCDDYFTYVCSGWMEKVKKILEPKNKPMLVGPLDSIQLEVVPRFVLRELKRLRKLANATKNNLRESEMQPAMFFKSCLRSIRKTNWEFNIITLRKFFHEVDLPFFDETADTKDNCTDKSPLTTLMKLALKFAIYPLFRIKLAAREINVDKTEFRKEVPDHSNRTAQERADDWTATLRDDIQFDELDTFIYAELGALLDAYHIRAPSSAIIRWGRNYEAVLKNYENEDGFSQYTNRTSYLLGQRAKVVDSTYLELLDQHTGNLAHLEGNHTISFAPSFFEPIIIMLTDKALAPIFTDYIRIYLLKEALPDLVKRTRCSIEGEECDEPQWMRNILRYCSDLVSAHHHRRGLIFS